MNRKTTRALVLKRETPERELEHNDTVTIPDESNAESDRKRRKGEGRRNLRESQLVNNNFYDNTVLELLLGVKIEVHSYPPRISLWRELCNVFSKKV